MTYYTTVKRNRHLVIYFDGMISKLFLNEKKSREKCYDILGFFPRIQKPEYIYVLDYMYLSGSITYNC